MNWTLNGQEITEISQFGDKAVGFIYKITNTKTGKFYIGKKILESRTKKTLTKKEQSEWSKPGRIPKKKVIIKESTWSTYWGSCKPLLEELKINKSDFKREIIKICFTKRELSYYEVYYQFEYKVLHVDSFNENVLGKFYRRDAQGANS
jgi:hypothetical protein